MKEINIVLAAAGGLILLLGLLSRPIDRSWLSPPLLAFCLGVALGPFGLNALDPAAWGDEQRLLEEATRLTLGISLMGIALRLPARFPFEQWRPLAVLLCIAMPAMFLVSALLAHWVIGASLLVALLIGASICATDPVIASSIVTGGVARKHLPGGFRHLLSTESGANDGLAYPLVLLPILLLTKPTQTAWLEWFAMVWLWEVGGSVLIGALLGWCAGEALKWAERRRFFDQPSFLAVTLALTLLVLGVGKLLGTDSILAVFAAGIAYDQRVGGKDRGEEENVQEMVNLFFTMPVLALFGLMAPWHEWAALGWSGLLLAILVLVLRRLPAILLLRHWLPPVRERNIALVMGWFGPIGVSALFYTVLAASRSGNDLVWVVGSLCVFASIVAHGVTAAPFARLYARHAKT
ncbi:NhaP-type Na+/H+ or K+/H+ antiporter [Modicisalibacter ilicicola DSM 19980]|uniref:NhaP-type Na+/H+ or K+/H+ antiporter n=1 Tax=Modicisalibacter ilicicola DSM 19980 TaxID=1121942 RepID=A0A1M5E4R1_9GAMM|nr:cation:proton antiporter [Halomonas ilicicola]SHF74185.1 NhaP-type Na+/H+ or K+/H+ antiporter [Halomonas ilicicola DSM 19980]